MKLRVPISGNLDACKGISILSTRLKRSNSKRDKHLHRKMIPFNLNFGLLFTISSIILILPTGILNPLIDTNQVFASTSTSTSTSTFDNGSVLFSNSGKDYDDDDDSDDGDNIPSYKLVSSKDPFEILGNVIDSNDDLDDDDIEDKDLQSSELSSNPSSSQVSTQSSNEVYGDFNGDGFDDLAIGVPFEDVDTGAGTMDRAGAVNVIYGSSSGLSATSPIPDQFWTQDTANVNDAPEDDDLFGFSLSAGDFNGDGFDDLAIGVPLEDVDTGAGTIIDAGAVNVLYGSSNGLSATSPRTDQFWTQDTTNVDDLAEFDGQFGSSLSAGNFSGDGFDDLAIGVPNEGVDTGAGTIPNAGAVNVIYGSSNGLSATSPIPDQFWTQDTANVNDLAEGGDRFGWSLSSGDFNGDGFDDLAIGVPFEDFQAGLDNMVDAGAVNVLYGSSNGLSATSPRTDQFWTQDTTNVNDLAEVDDNFGSSLSAGDFNGDGFDDLAIGVPFEDFQAGLDNMVDAGAVSVIYGSLNGLSATSPRTDQFWTQDISNVNDLAELGDRFGSSLSAGDFNGDGFDDLAIGVPFEDVDTGAGTMDRAGAVNVIYGSSSGLSATSPIPDQFWTQDTANVNDLAEVDDYFGVFLSAGDFNGDGFDDLAIGVPFEDVDTGAGTLSDAGAVHVLYSSSNGLSATSPRTDQFWTQDTTNVNDLAEVGDEFGRALG